MANVVIDMTGWILEEKSLRVAACVRLLHNAGITHGAVSPREDGVAIETPSADPSATLTSSAVKTWIDNLRALLATRAAEEATEQTARDSEVSANEFTGVKLSQVDARIDAVSNLAELKVLLKKFVRFIVASQGRR